jgi:hypothetical protein
VVPRFLVLKQGEREGRGWNWTVPVFILNWEHLNLWHADVDDIPLDGNPHPRRMMRSIKALELADQFLQNFQNPHNLHHQHGKQNQVQNHHQIEQHQQNQENQNQNDEEGNQPDLQDPWEMAA